jgi:hypothetical protein
VHRLQELLATDDVDVALKRMGIDEPSAARLEVVGYPFGSPATAALYRLRAGEQTLFCKVLQHVRHWPGLQFMPLHLVDDFMEQLPWRAELALWEPRVIDTLPVGLRAPTRHALVELPDDRAAVWMEDVIEASTPWDLDRYRRAAHLLGRWNARSTDPDLLAQCADTGPNYALRMYAQHAVAYRGLVPLADDGLWSHPWLAGHADLRAELQSLAREIPSMLDRMDSFVLCSPHGDASPQNLLVPADDPDSFVIIDISFCAPHALGFDLGQLLVGLVHAGQMPAARLPEIAAAIGPAYVDGLHDEGIHDQDEAALDAFVTGAMLRSGFDGFLLDLLEHSAEEDRHAFDERLVLSRFLVEQCLSSR